jgi:DNA polymerase-4
MKRWIAHLDMDAFFASVEQALNPFLQGKAICVSGKSETRGVIAASSYEAKKYGVKSGMNIREALHLCPHATIVKGDFNRYSEVSRQIFSSIESITGSVEVASIDEAFFDLTDTVFVEGSPECAASLIKKRVKERTGLPCSVGVSSNKTVAKISSAFCKPDGILVVPCDQIADFMHSLPIEKVPGIGPRLTERLHLMGLFTCGALTLLPLSFWHRRFGLYGIKIYQWCMGRGAEHITTVVEDPKSFSHSCTLPKNTLDIEFLRSILFRLAERVAARMRESGWYGSRISCKIRFEDFISFERQAPLPSPSCDEKEFFTTAWQIIEPYLSSKKVRQIGLTLCGLTKTPQLHLFRNTKREKTLAAMDSLNAKYGSDTLFLAASLYGKDRMPALEKVHAFSPG